MKKLIVAALAALSFCAHAEEDPTVAANLSDPRQPARELFNTEVMTAVMVQFACGGGKTDTVAIGTAKVSAIITNFSEMFNNGSADPRITRLVTVEPLSYVAVAIASKLYPCK